MKRIDQISKKSDTMGILEQLAEIRAEKAVDKTNRQFVQNLLNGTAFSSEKIASLVGVSVEFVETVRKELQSN